MRAGAAGVYDPFRNTFVVEMRNLFSKNEVFEQRRAAIASF